MMKSNGMYLNYAKCKVNISYSTSPPWLCAENIAWKCEAEHSGSPFLASVPRPFPDCASRKGYLLIRQLCWELYISNTHSQCDVCLHNFTSGYCQALKRDYGLRKRVWTCMCACYCSVKSRHLQNVSSITKRMRWMSNCMTWHWESNGLWQEAEFVKEPARW